MSATYDIRVEDHGTICLLIALTNGAVTWLSENLAADVMMSGKHIFVVEPRYAGPIIEGAAAADLNISI